MLPAGQEDRDTTKRRRKMSLDGKVVFVSGASRPLGIGKATALALARQGADVAVSGFSHIGGAQAVADEIKALGRRSFAVKMDLRNYDEVKKGMEAIKAELGPVNILVNNAAQIGHHVTIAKTTVEEWDNEVKICLNSAFYCIKEVWADMCAGKWGRIVNITSVAGHIGGYGQSSYGAAKAGLTALAKSIALEGARFNITANCILVGVSNTDNHMQLPPEVREKIEKRTVLHRAAKPEEIAGAVVYLTSDAGAYMTGAVMNLLGGLDLFVF
jgi:3-oxoacyl-[acyl-carrier protein] reductase